MAQTHDGAIKICASKAGVTVKVYLEKTNQGLKWCYACSSWHSVSRFGRDASRYDGLTSICTESRNEKNREKYSPIPADKRKPMGPHFHAPRDNDKIQARQRINVLVRTGRKPHPNSIPCKDCGHIWEPGQRRHVYDHYLGYLAAHHYDVESVCTLCDARRSIARGEMRDMSVRDSKGRLGALKNRAKIGGSVNG